MLRRIHAVGFSRLLTLGEAAVCLIVARTALRIVPFRYIVWALNRPWSRSVTDNATRSLRRRRVSWAVERVAHSLPGQTVCFPKAIAAYFMCRLRGIPGTLYYGVTKSAASGLKAHVWLQDGPVGIVGHSVAEEYGVLLRFPGSVV